MGQLRKAQVPETEQIACSMSALMVGEKPSASPPVKVWTVNKSSIFALRCCKENSKGTKYYASAQNIRRVGIV